MKKQINFNLKLGYQALIPNHITACDSVRHLFSQIVNPEGINIISGNIGG